MARHITIDISFRRHGHDVLPYIYMPATENEKRPYQRALYDLENAMSPEIYEFDPSRLLVDRRTVTCNCDRCRRKK